MTDSTTLHSSFHVANGWSIYLHPAFLNQLEELIGKVEICKKRNPNDWRKKKLREADVRHLQAAYRRDSR